MCTACFGASIAAVFKDRGRYGPHKPDGRVGLLCPGVTGRQRCTRVIEADHPALRFASSPSNAQIYQERMSWAATPTEEQFRCPKCDVQIIVTDQHGERLGSTGACPNCHVSVCVTCGVAPFHGGMTCTEFNRTALLSGGQTPRGRASDKYVKATSKACPGPGCGQAISHFHGHQCHHISPSSDGCSLCHTHFCFQCLHIFPQDSGSPNNHTCPNGCATFCKSGNIGDNLVTEPVPHDRRCGCVICPDCRLGQPCEICDGQCVVCKGVTPPGPQSCQLGSNWRDFIANRHSGAGKTPPAAVNHPTTPRRSAAADVDFWWICRVPGCRCRGGVYPGCSRVRGDVENPYPRLEGAPPLAPVAPRWWEGQVPPPPPAATSLPASLPYVGVGPWYHRCCNTCVACCCACPTDRCFREKFTRLCSPCHCWFQWFESWTADSRQAVFWALVCFLLFFAFISSPYWFID